MKNLPNLTITKQSYYGEFLKTGTISNKYKPFKNLVLDNGAIANFKTKNLKLDLNSPVNIEIQPSFDGSTNLILNNDNLDPLLINSRFSLEEGDNYSIIDHKGNKDTNLYTDSQLDLDTRLYKTINIIPSLSFEGLYLNGAMKCGNYHFYFKFADNDGNETDFISESGLVTCHIGNLNDPHSIRMGMIDEDSKKSIKFTLSNLDTSYDFIKIYYTRSTSDNTQQTITTAHYIDNKFPIINNTSEILITGFEIHQDIPLLDINPSYELVKSVKAQTQVQNMLIFGNVYKPEIPYQELEDLSLRFVPQLTTDTIIGNVEPDYLDNSTVNPYEYYNPKNIYYNLGLWPEEYYRLGIVYLMTDFTLSPVFNMRGLEFADNVKLPTATHFDVLNGTDRNYITYDDEGFINKNVSFENVRGVIKLGKMSTITNGGVSPIGLNILIQDENSGIPTLDILKKYTKGFFIVRQQRVPTIYAQGLTIAKTKNDFGNIPVISDPNNYFAESFLEKVENKNILKNNKIGILSDNIETKAAIVPEAEVRDALFGQLFTSTNYKLTKSVDQPVNTYLFPSLPNNNYNLQINKQDFSTDINESLLTLVKDGTKITTNGTDYFSAKAGEATESWRTIDVSKSWKTPKTGAAKGATEINTDLTESDSLIRGEFGTYVGLSNGTLPFGTIFNIRSADFDNSSNYKYSMFKIRMDSSEAYYAMSDRLSWATFEKTNKLVVYRGDCFISNFTHRLNRNFIDPELPTNNEIIDIRTWYKNYAIQQDTSSYVSGNSGPLEATNRILTTYKQKGTGAIIEPSEAKYANIGTGIGSITGDGDSDYLIKGCDKINRSDVNAVKLGKWVTFKVMSNINLSMRDIDFNNPVEESTFGMKRSSYPLKAINPADKLPDSNVINGAANITLSKRYNFLIPDVPFIKNKFDTRILYSDIHITDAFKNGYRVFTGGHYRDYPKTYGAIIDIKEWYGNLFCTMEHGCLLIPVNERAVAAEGQGGLAYINTSNVLPENPRVVSDLFGSTWQESVIKTKSGIYGIDTVAKKIWKATPNQDGNLQLENISDLKVQRFLNENINLKEVDKVPTMGLRNVKSHYNKNKGDILFTFYNGDKEWNLCYNENLQKFITFYSWTPSYSANINNIFFTFDKKDSELIDTRHNSVLWKHGQSGIYSNANTIKPTNWYGNQEPFEFEFVVTEIPSVQKIFNNLKLISNKAEPNSFEFEIVGETYNWFEIKDLIVWINKNSQQLAVKSDIKFGSTNGNLGLIDLQKAYKYILSLNLLEIEGEYAEFIRPFNKEGIEFDTYKFPKLVYLNRIRKNNLKWEGNSSNIELREDNLLTEDRVHIQQLGNSIKKYGRVKGNMMYLEDLWDVEIRPITFSYAYLSNNKLMFTKDKESRIRDKYMKVRVKYSGNDLAIIQGIKTTFTISYA